MFDLQKFKSALFSINETNFTKEALAAFGYQWTNNAVYHQYCENLSKNPSNVSQLEDIPFLPIEFYKIHAVETGTWAPQRIFRSSGTTGKRSEHRIRDENWYHAISRHIFERQFGPLAHFEILALLPSYLEQKDSSLISMVDYFIRSSQPGSRFLLNKPDQLKELLMKKPAHRRLLIGVSYALLDFAETISEPIGDCLIMETGGMKGRRKELTRMELHKKLKEAFGPQPIYSEYGMTELLSQAYGANGEFAFPTWCRVMIREINDPLSYLMPERTGGINVIDLANIDSCCFIETKDLGKVQADGTLSVLGRFDNTDLRGCNLMI